MSLNTEEFPYFTYFYAMQYICFHCFSGLHCLNDVPQTVEWPSYAQPYGVSWTMDEQCRQEFGDTYKLCAAVSSVTPTSFVPR